MKRTIHIFLLFASISLISSNLGGQNVIVNGYSNTGLTSYMTANSIPYSTNVTSASTISAASHIFWVGNNSYAGTESSLRNFVQNGGVLVISGDCNMNNNIAASLLLNLTFGLNVGFTNISVPGLSNGFCSANTTAVRNANCASATAVCSRLDYDSLSYPQITQGLNSLSYNSAVNVAGTAGLISVNYKSSSSSTVSNKLDIASIIPYGNGIIIVNGDASIFNSSANNQYFANILNYAARDTILPTVNTKNIRLALDSNGRAFLSPSDVDNGSFDNVGITTLGVSPSIFDCSDLGANTVSLTATDAASNSASANAVVTVFDSIAPKAVANSISVNLDANGNASIKASDIDKGSTDNCAIASMRLSRSSFNCADAGNAVQIRLTVIDLSGNIDSTFAMVNVSDSLLADADNDGIKDPCDLDDDNDGIPDSVDKYPLDSTNNGKGVIVSYIWDDLNGDGIQDANEPPLAGMKVKAYGWFFRYLGQATSDSTGLVAFFNLDQNESVWLKYVRKDGQAFTYRDEGSDRSLDSDVSQLFGLSPRIVAKSGKIIDYIDAGIWSPGSIETYVWNDQNADGIQDPSESGMAGVEVKLLNWCNREIGQSYTDSNGIANFSNVDAGRIHKLKYVAPANFQFTLKDRGNDINRDSDANGNSGKTSSFILTKGAQVMSSIDAGLIPSSSQLRISDSSGVEVLAETPTISSESIGFERELDVQMYPNPVMTDFNLRINSPVEDQAVIIVHNLMGVKVMEKTIALQQGESVLNFDFSSSNLARGNYVLTIYPGNQEVKSIKFIKQ